jgi:hypothetical protein
MEKFCRFCFPFLLICFFHSSLSATPPLTYQQTILQKAEQLRLSEARMWHILLHYTPNLLGGFTSEADGSGFFLAANGKNNPAAELAATLRAFAAPAIMESETQQHPQCQFPARYAWLKAELGFEPQQLPEQPCPRLQKWRNTIRAGGVTFIFAAAYLNNPASMFGHTFLRLDRQGLESVPLVSYIVNYSAVVATNNPLIYTFKGLFGGFQGRFSTLPYYLKVREYSSMENRDLWEYHLNISIQRIEALTGHIWELGSTYFNYYYLDENCAYHILSLIEFMVPDFQFRDMVGNVYVTPLETLKLLYRLPNLVDRVTFRPSIQREMQMMKIELSPAEQAAVETIVRQLDHPDFDCLQPFRDEQKMRILDTAQKLFRYRVGYGLPEAVEKKVALLERKIQTQRSHIQLRSPTGEIPAPPNPVDAHSPAMIRIAGGSDDGVLTSELMLRTSLHDLLNDHLGYIEGTEIELSSLSIRADLEHGRVYPGQGNLVKITSLVAGHGWTRQLSWKFWSGLATPRELGARHWHDLYAGIAGGPGIAAISHALTTEIWYLFGDLELDAGRQLNQNYRIGGGGSTGCLLDILPGWRGQLEGRYLYHFLGDQRSGQANWKITTGTTVTLAHAWEFRLSGEYYHQNHREIFGYVGKYF